MTARHAARLGPILLVAACFARTATPGSGVAPPAVLGVDEGALAETRPHAPDGVLLVTHETPASALTHGYLNVLCLPACDAVFVDDEPVGASPVFHLVTSAGRHRIRLVRLDPSVERVVATEVQAGYLATVRETMVAGSSTVRSAR